MEPDEDHDRLQPLILPTHSMLERFETVNILAPLVRCSKLPFRHLCSLYETHVTHTPMILAEEFSRSQIARVSDFSTSNQERGVFWMNPREARHASGRIIRGDDRDLLSRPAGSRSLESSACIHTPSPEAVLVRGNVIAQFASPNGPSLSDAAELISPYVDGIDINCGCPQKWAFNEGIGCALLRRPDLVADMIRCVKDRMGWDWPVSVKIRVDPDLKRTDQLVRTAIAAGASHITIHGRTRHQASTEDVSLAAIHFAIQSARGEVPCVANGDLWTFDQAEEMRRATGARGVMGARGLLANPALFAGFERTPVQAVEQFVGLSMKYGFIFPLFHRHLSYMLESHFNKAEKTWFNSLSSSAATIDYLSGAGVMPALHRGTAKAE